jgi:hypothetical protein
MVEVKSHQKINSYLQKIDFRIKRNHELLWVKYVQLGSRVVRLLCYSKDFIPLIEKQLSYTLRDSSEKFDATIVMWHEKKITEFTSSIIDIDTKSRIRLQQLMSKSVNIDLDLSDDSNPQHKILIRVNSKKEGISHLEVFDHTYSKHNPLIKSISANGVINAFDSENNIYYYGVEDLHPEEFIKQGHIFVQIFNKILKTENSNLAHGAVVGLNNQGILFCARGQRGKSTLAVLSMMEGFEYVSDDYLLLEKEGDTLYSYPIYSIITLSPRMYNELYDDLKGKFVSNNARRDKYVIDIKAYHETFRDKYPVKVCMFPQIVSDEKPSIVRCKKGRAITQLVHSTINQMEDRHDIKTIKKLISFVDYFEFYQINLCSDIKANVECLREFSNQINRK